VEDFFTKICQRCYRKPVRSKYCDECKPLAYSESRKRWRLEHPGKYKKIRKYVDRRDYKRRYQEQKARAASDPDYAQKMRDKWRRAYAKKKGHRYASKSSQKTT
jgi:hypothetical protein